MCRFHYVKFSDSRHHSNEAVCQFLLSFNNLWQHHSIEINLTSLLKVKFVILESFFVAQCIVKLVLLKQVCKMSNKIDSLLS